MNAENAGDEGASTEPDDPLAGDQHEPVARDVESARPDTDPTRQSAETMRKVAEAVQSPSPALRSATAAARTPGSRAAFTSRTPLPTSRR